MIRPAALAILVSSFLFSGCSAKESDQVAPTVTVEVATAENKAMENKVVADAILYPRDQAAITPKISAPVQKFYVDRGSKVHAGQLLAELENEDLRGAVAENQGGYQQAQAEYDTTVQKAQQDLNLAKEQMDEQQKVYESRENLFKQGAISSKEVDDARIALTQDRDQYDLAQKQHDLKAAEGQLSSAKGRSASAEAQLSYTRIVSPIDGVVTDRPVYQGEMAPSGSPILTVMDLSQIIARAHISQEEASRIKVGASATISVVRNDSEIPGKVTLVSPALDPNSTTVEIWVQAANPGERMKPGASARVSIVAETIPHAISIPADAVLTGDDGSKSVVMLDAQNNPHKQPVKTGIQDGDDIQVTEGLKANDRVVTSGAFELDKEDPDVLAKTKIQVQAPEKSGDDSK